MTRLLALLIIVLAALAPLSMAENTAATNAFHKLQALAGEWEGKDDSGNLVKTRFQPVAGNTAVMETLAMPEMEEMVTMYNVDGDGIALVHYCPTNNQPHMRAIPASGDPKELVFSFQGATNLPDLAIGHEQKMLIEFRGKDEIVEHWTWRKNGKDTEMIYHFTRTAAAKK